eukprot:jgi/Bigna1/75676/fgenesh1_pg.36_\
MAVLPLRRHPRLLVCIEPTPRRKCYRSYETTSPISISVYAFDNVQSLSLSLHIISSTQQQHQQQHQLNKPLSSPRGSVSVSPSCLLKASSRVVEMHTTGGDVATASGVLYRRTPASHVSPVNRCPNPATGQPAPTMRGGGWMVYMQWAKWSVHHELKTHKYSLVIQDLHPIQPSPSRVASSSSSSTPLLRTHTYNTNASRTNRQVSSSRHHRGDASDEEDDATSSFVNYIPTSSGKSSVNHRDGSILGAVSRRFSADSPGSSSSSSSPSSSLVFELETSLRFRLIAPGDLKDSQNASSSSSSSSSSGERKGQGHYHNDDNGAEAKERGFVNVSTATLQGRHKHQHGDKRGHSDNNGDSNSKSSHMAFSSSSAVAESPAAAASSSSSSSSSSSFLRAKRSGIAKIIKPLEHAEGFIWEKKCRSSYVPKVANVVQYEYAFLLDTAASTGLETALDSRGGVSGRGLPNERLAGFGSLKTPDKGEGAEMGLQYIFTSKYKSLAFFPVASMKAADRTSLGNLSPAAKRPRALPLAFKAWERAVVSQEHNRIHQTNRLWRRELAD